MYIVVGLLFFASHFLTQSQASELLTNSARFTNPPKWLSPTRVNRVADRIQNFMEWSIRRVEVVWYQDQAAFLSAHKMGPAALAVTFKNQNRVLLGPRVTEANFDQIFGHELVHVISAQKYKEAIPPWLEEGVANFISQTGKVDYQFLSTRPLPQDFRELSHPMSGTQEGIRERYMHSQALTELIASKCDFRNLLRLSVQRKLENYLANICRISDLNVAYREWIQKQATKKKS